MCVALGEKSNLKIGHNNYDLISCRADSIATNYTEVPAFSLPVAVVRRYVWVVGGCLVGPLVLIALQFPADFYLLSFLKYGSGRMRGNIGFNIKSAF